MKALADIVDRLEQYNLVYPKVPDEIHRWWIFSPWNLYRSDWTVSILQ